MKKTKSKRKSNAELSQAEKKLLTQIASKIRKDLYNLDKPLEWLAWESEVSRSTVQRVLDANRNIGIVTLDKIAKGLGYKSAIELLSQI